MSGPLRIDAKAIVGKRVVEEFSVWNGICDCPKYPKTHPAHLSGGSVHSTRRTDDRADS